MTTKKHNGLNKTLQATARKSPRKTSVVITGAAPTNKKPQPAKTNQVATKVSQPRRRNKSGGRITKISGL